MNDTEWKISIEDTLAEMTALHEEMGRQLGEVIDLLARLTKAVSAHLLPEVKA